MLTLRVAALIALGPTLASAQRVARGEPNRPLRAESIADTSLASLVRAELTFMRDVDRRRIDGWTEAFADDGAMLPDRRAPSVGQSAVRALMRGTFADTSVHVVWLPVFAEVAKSGDVGYTYGFGRWTSRDASGKANPPADVKYATVWRREASGRWKVVLDVGNDAPVPAGFFDGR